MSQGKINAESTFQVFKMNGDWQSSIKCSQNRATHNIEKKSDHNPPVLK